MFGRRGSHITAGDSEPTDNLRKIMVFSMVRSRIIYFIRAVNMRLKLNINYRVTAKAPEDKYIGGAHEDGDDSGGR